MEQHADQMFDGSPCINHQPTNFSVNDIVNVLPRTSVGMNKLGGIARVRTSLYLYLLSYCLALST